MFRFVLVVGLVLGVAMDAGAQATSLDNVPIAWGEVDERHTTVCSKRWHAIKIRDIRTRAVDMGLGAEEQVQRESRAVFAGEADCFTGQLIYQPVAHGDIILNARTWFQMVDKDGPVACFKGLRCRWVVQTQSFVEAQIELDGIEHADIVYVATPRPVQPARVGPTPPVITSEDIKKP